MTPARVTYDRLNELSRERALTDEESQMLFKSMRQLWRKPRTREPKKQVGQARGPWSWSYDDDAKFFDAIADGMPIAAAGRLVGKNNAASQGRFSRARKAMGWQAS